MFILTSCNECQCSTWYLALRILAVLSPNFEWVWDLLNFLIVASGPYFPMRYRKVCCFFIFSCLTIEERWKLRHNLALQPTSFLGSENSAFGFLKGRKWKLLFRVYSIFPLQGSNSKFNSRKDICSRCATNLYFWTKKHEIKHMLMLSLTHVTAEHEEKKNVWLQNKIKFKPECFVVQLKNSNVSSK